MLFVNSERRRKVRQTTLNQVLSYRVDDARVFDAFARSLRSSAVWCRSSSARFAAVLHVGRPVPVAHLLQRVSDRLERLLPPLRAAPSASRPAERVAVDDARVFRGGPVLVASSASPRRPPPRQTSDAPELARQRPRALARRPTRDAPGPFTYPRRAPRRRTRRTPAASSTLAPRRRAQSVARSARAQLRDHLAQMPWRSRRSARRALPSAISAAVFPPRRARAEDRGIRAGSPRRARTVGPRVAGGVAPKSAAARTRTPAPRAAPLNAPSRFAPCARRATFRTAERQRALRDDRRRRPSTPRPLRRTSAAASHPRGAWAAARGDAPLGNASFPSVAPSSVRVVEPCIAAHLPRPPRARLSPPRERLRALALHGVPRGLLVPPLARGADLVEVQPQRRALARGVFLPASSHRFCTRRFRRGGRRGGGKTAAAWFASWSEAFRESSSARCAARRRFFSLSSAASWSSPSYISHTSVTSWFTAPRWRVARRGDERALRGGPTRRRRFGRFSPRRAAP